MRTVIFGLWFSIGVFAQSVSSVMVSPANLSSGQRAVAKVTLSSVAGDQGLNLSISLNTPNATVPAVMTVPAGDNQVTFPVVAADSLSRDEIATLTVSGGPGSASAFIALNQPYVSNYPVTVTLQNGVNGYTGCVDRLLGAGAGGQYAVKDATYVSMRYAGDQKDWYLFWCDLGFIPKKSIIQSATLTFGSLVYAGGTANAQMITDPDSLGGDLPQGWGISGQAAAVSKFSGATPAFRNQTASGTGTKWRASDPNDDHSHIAGVLANSEGPVTYTRNGKYSHTVTAAVQSWVDGAPNQGWALSADSDTANIQLFSVNDPVASNRPTLTVTFTPASADTTPPATITDLALVSCTPEAPIRCTFQWTAPGDDGMNGTAAAYEFSYSNSPVTGSSPAASIVPAPAPLSAGSLQTITVENLGQGYSYYFAVRTRDAAYNWSPLSNNVTVATPDPRGVISEHPRILLNTRVPDTWTPALDRLSAIRNRIQSGQPQADFKALRTLVNGYRQGNLFAVTDNAALLLPVSFAFMYQMLKPTEPDAADSYADYAIDKFLLVAPWNDGGYDDTVAFQAEAAALIYDWCYDRIVSRNLKAQAITSLKNAYALLAADSFWQENIRESDFHNYSVEIENAYIALGLALFGDDPSASTMLDRGWGMFAEGYPFQPTAFGDTFTFNLKQSIDVLTGGAMNWEGPVYWRASVPEILRGIEAYDTATNRAHSVWSNLFSNVINAGYYKIYMLQPDGANPGLGDATTDVPTAGRDNFGMVLLLDRFKDGYIKTFIDTAVRVPWDAGSGGSAGLIWKLIFYDYTGQVVGKPYSDLPTSREFGKDVVMRTGWGPDDTYVTFSAGYTGPFHNHLDQGAFTIFRRTPLLGTGGAYTVSYGPYYYSYFKRSIASDVPLIYDPSECWRDSTSACTLSNDGGQRWPWRRYQPPFATNLYGINRLWSGTALTDPISGPSYREQFVAATKTANLNRASGTIDYISSDLTKAYVNSYSSPTGSPGNINTSSRVSLVTRDFLFLKPRYIVVFDRVSATSGDFKKSLPFHTFSAPTLDGSTPRPGVNTYPKTTIQADNGGGRLFIQPLLPAGAQLRVAGGNDCLPVRIVNCSNDNPSVCQTDQPHHLSEGEVFGVAGGPPSPGNLWASDGGINTDNPNVGALLAHVIDDTTFTPVRFNNGVPIRGTTLGQYPGGMQINYRAGCGYEGYVDDYLGRPANLWWPANNIPAIAAVTPRWRTEIQAPSGSATDYFLNVLYPTTTASGSMALTSLIDTTNYYGAIIADSDSPQIALFSKTPEPQNGLTYTAAYAGTGQHVITGLRPGEYLVSLNGVVLAGSAGLTVGDDGLLRFTSGAGTISVTAAIRSPEGIH